MYKIFIPTSKRQATSRGYWLSDSGKLCKDFIRYENVNTISNKYLDSLLKDYKQEAIFYEVINKASGNYNRGVCYYNKDKKDVSNKKRQIFCDSISELKEGIRKFKRQGINCYTIDRIKQDYYILFTWIKRPDHKKRVIYRNKLVKKLFTHYVKKVNYDNIIPVKIRISKHYGGNYNRPYTSWLNNNLIENHVIINPDVIRKRRIYEGYTIDGYYKGRHLKLNPLVLHNNKRAIRFVILHELGHAYFNVKHIERTKKSYTIERKERF